MSVGNRTASVAREGRDHLDQRPLWHHRVALVQWCSRRAETDKLQGRRDFVPRRQPRSGSMSEVELAVAFLSGVAMGIVLDRWLLPPLVDAWIDRMRWHGR